MLRAPGVRATTYPDSNRSRSNPIRRRLLRRSCRQRLCRSAFLPAPGFFQCVGDFRWHVLLVVLGENAAGGEHAIGPHAALGDDALSFAEQIGQYAIESDSNIGLAVGNAKTDPARVGLFGK